MPDLISKSFNMPSNLFGALRSPDLAQAWSRAVYVPMLGVVSVSSEGGKLLEGTGGGGGLGGAGREVGGGWRGQRGEGSGALPPPVLKDDDRPGAGEGRGPFPRGQGAGGSEGGGGGA